LRIAIQQRQPLLGFTTHKQLFTETNSALLSFTQLCSAFAHCYPLTSFTQLYSASLIFTQLYSAFTHCYLLTSFTQLYSALLSLSQLYSA
jgi:hypothetical protein